MVDMRGALGLVAHQRRLAGLTQEELAHLSGVSVRTIRNLETNAIGRPRPSTLKLLLGAMGVHVDDTPLIASAEAARPTVIRSRKWLTSGTCGSQLDLIGRDRDVEQVSAAIQAARLVTLVGPGGIGKTELALAAAQRACHLLHSEIILTDFRSFPAEVNDDSVVAADVREAVTSSIELARQAHPQTATLVVIDNAEHVLTSVAGTVIDVLQEYPDLRVVVTTRRQLPVASAHVYEVQPLETSPRDGALPAATQLFLHLARSACPTLDLSSDLGAVMELCCRLGGVPLAIELAVSRIRSVPLDVVLRDGPTPRLLDEALVGHSWQRRSISASLQWSYDLLNSDQQQLLEELTRFSGTFAVDDINGKFHGDRSYVLSLLADLVDASLVRIDRGARYIYSLQPFVRAYLTSVSESRPHRQPVTAAQTAR
jgi:predicted ATPase/DNA-binding XRE family transcriptional regulator